MDKQDAIDLIVEQYEQGRLPSDIARSLSGELKAPYDIVLSFVNRTLEKRMTQLSPPQPLAPARPSEISPAAPPPAAPSDMYTPAENYSASEDYSETPVEPARSSYAWEAPPEAAIAPAAMVGAPPPQAAPASQPASPAASAASIDPQLEKFILNQLSGHKKHSDVVMAVCERAQVDWNEAQRMVGFVQSRNRKKIATRRNLFMIPFSLVIMLAGLALLAAIIQEAAPYLPMLQRFDAGGFEEALQALPTQDVVGPRTLFFYLVMGLSLAVGGLVGLIRALQTQFE